MDSAVTACPTCGSPVRVVGDTTKHYEPVLQATMTRLAIENVLRGHVADIELDLLVDLLLASE